MKPSKKAALYFHTLRYLKPEQVWGRVFFHLRRPRPDLRAAPPLREGSPWTWRLPARRRPSLLGENLFHFLNEEGEVLSHDDWSSSARKKLWLYNMHYFDDLNAFGAAERKPWHQLLISRWIDENPPGKGVGWEPYPLSLRIVNWIKWVLAGNGPDDAFSLSLAVQARYLAGRLEYHLLGNHLFANAKALVFAGCFFAGEEAESWLHRGMAILAREIPEQILSDGGHFERSPMYHALVWEDMLDLTNLADVFPEAMNPWQAMTATWPDLLDHMGHWLAAMCHPDGEISFFNDAAVGIAPAPAELFNYARLLGLAPPQTTDDIVWLRDSGYVRIQQGEALLLIDAAPVGPDYLPGHAHADTLSFELSLDLQRLVVNGGTSVYGVDEERQRQRSTAAHATVVVDGENSSEVWSGFRVARRARIVQSEIWRDGEATVTAAHDGYRRLSGSPVHRRTWSLKDCKLYITDQLIGAGKHQMEIIFPLAAGLSIKKQQDNLLQIIDEKNEGLVCLLQCGDGIEAAAERTTWHPRFGETVEAWRIRLSLWGELPLSHLTVLRWGDRV